MTEISIPTSENVHFTFSNGLVVSLYIGSGSYSSARNIRLGLQKSSKLSTPNVELGVWKEGNKMSKWVTHYFADTGGDSVAGFVDVDDVIDILVRARGMTSEEVAALRGED